MIGLIKSCDVTGEVMYHVYHALYHVSSGFNNANVKHVNDIPNTLPPLGPQTRQSSYFI